MAHSFSTLRKFDNYVRNRIAQKAPVIRINVNLNEFCIISIEKTLFEARHFGNGDKKHEDPILLKGA